MKKNNLFFSVIVPTYNREEVLVQSINSVLSQTFNDFELIIIDDGSKDKTEKIVLSIKDPRIKYIKNQRKKGACGARNTGAKVAKGKWLAFLDSDDYWGKEKLENFHEFILNNPDYSCIYSGYKRKREGAFVDVVSGFSGSHYNQLCYSNCVKGMSLFAVKKSVFWEVGGFDENFQSRQDLELYFKLSKKYSFGFINQALTFISYSEKNRITYNRSKKLSGQYRFYKKYKNDFTYRVKAYHLKRISALLFEQRKLFKGFFYFLLFIYYKLNSTL